MRDARVGSWTSRPVRLVCGVAVLVAAIAVSASADPPHAPGARDSARLSWRERHPWPPWWVLPAEAPGPPAPGLPAWCGPPAPDAQTAAADPGGDDASTARYLAAARDGFTPASRLYAACRVALRVVEPLYAILAALLFLVSGLSAALRDLANRLTRRHYARVLVYLVLYSALGFLIALPLLGFGDFALEHRFGLSTQSFGGWLGDQLKGMALEIVFLGVIPLLAFGYRLLERRPRAGWAWLAGASVPLIVVSMWLIPVVVEPAFNHFRPLSDPELRRDILGLAERAGIPGSRVYEVDRSQQTTTLNAYVNGIGSSHRIVIWDTAIRTFRRDELLFVTGHEIGHYRLGHIRTGILLAAALSVIGFLLAGWLARASVRRFGASWGIASVSDIASLPLLVAIFTLLASLGEPAVNAWSRGVERDADLYGLELTRDNDAAARAFVRMAAVNRSDPDPPELVHLIYGSHPTIAERIRLACTYHPWREGKPARLYLGPGPSEVRGPAAAMESSSPAAAAGTISDPGMQRRR